MSTSISTTALAKTENDNSLSIIQPGKSFKSSTAFLHWLHAIALFTFAGFVTFSIAGAHISLGLLTLCVVVQMAEGRGQRAKSEGRRAEGEERRAESEGRRAEGEERRAESEGRKAKGERRKSEEENTNAEASSTPGRSSIRLGIEWPIVAFVIASLISTIFSETPFESFRNLRHLLTILGAYAVALSLRWYPQWRQPVLWSFIGSATVASLYGLGKFALGFSGKVQSTQATTMTWGALCVMFMALTLQMALAAPVRRDRWLARVFILPQAFALLLSMVRGAYVGFAASIIYLLRSYWANRRLLVRRILPALAAIVLVAAIFSPASVRQRIALIFDLKYHSTQVRLVQWQYALQIAADHPVFGTGWRDMLPVFRRYVPPDIDVSDHVKHDIFTIGHFHNTYVMVLVCSGVAGLTAFLWLMAAVWRNLGAAVKHAGSEQDRLVTQASLAAMIGFLVAGIFDWTFGDAEVVTMFWFVIGMGLGQTMPEGKVRS
jgi:O-antigen ligase